MLSTASRLCLSLVTLAALGVSASAQQQPAAAPTTPPTTGTAPAPQPPPSDLPKLPPPPPRTAVAATVNGQNILEISVYRALSRIPVKAWPEARTEIVNFLVENVLIDQYLEQLKIQLDQKEIDTRHEQVVKEIQGQNTSLDKVLEDLFLTKEELRQQIVGVMRWDKFVDVQAPDKVLQDMFEKNKNMFDGSLVRARHLLMAAKPGDTKAIEDAKAKLAVCKQQIEAQAAQELAKVPQGTDPLAREKARMKAMDDAFSTAASKDSSCPSKAQGGDIGLFPRVGRMVEPFARTAFELKLYQISEPVTTEFGCHLIMVTDQKPGKDVKFEEVKEMVKEVYSERLREAVLNRMRQPARITITPVPAAATGAAAPKN